MQPTHSKHVSPENGISGSIGLRVGLLISIGFALGSVLLLSPLLASERPLPPPNSAIVTPTPCISNAGCDDGVFCNGAEQCRGFVCVSGRPPCVAVGYRCNESGRGCDAPPTPTPIRICISDQECSDLVFCNGIERCIPGRAGADSRGCNAPQEPACRPGQECDEIVGRCRTPCPVMLDADGDMHVTAICGGDDCDDHEPNRHPGMREVCDAEGHDEDCNPATYGRRDLDGDGEDDVRCFNRAANGTIYRGTDIDDNNPAVRLGSMICDGLDAVIVSGSKSAPCPTGTKCVVQPNRTGVCIFAPDDYVQPPPPRRPEPLPTWRMLLSGNPTAAPATSSGGGSKAKTSEASANKQAPGTNSAGGSDEEVAQCRSTLQSGKVSWGGGTDWSPVNIDKLCNATKNAKNTIACFESTVGKLGWAAAIDMCK